MTRGEGKFLMWSKGRDVVIAKYENYTTRDSTHLQGLRGVVYSDNLLKAIPLKQAPY